METAEKSSRRRGVALEEAILEAAWEELTERGYSDFTLEGVAKRAGTSRPVLSRRWANRSSLAAAAMARDVARNPVVVPDLGDVGAELSWLLRQISDRGRPDMVRVWFEIGRDLMNLHSNLADFRAQVTDPNVVGHPVRDILQRGIARGEVEPSRVTPRVIALPTDLMRHELLMTFAPLTDEAIHEIVHQIVLPLVMVKS